MRASNRPENFLFMDDQIVRGVGRELLTDPLSVLCTMIEFVPSIMKMSLLFP